MDIQPSSHPFGYREPRSAEKDSPAQPAQEDLTLEALNIKFDEIFKSAAKEEAVKALYSNIANLKSEYGKTDIAGQMRNFLDMRSLVRPEHREKCAVKLVEHPNGDHEYSLTLCDHDIYGPKKVDDRADIAALRRADNAVKVDNYLLKLQDHRPDAAGLLAGSDTFFVKQGQVGDCYLLATLIGILSNPGMREKIESMAEVTDTGIRLTLPVDGHAANSWNQGKNLAVIVAHRSSKLFLHKKGYDLSWKADSPHFNDARGLSRKLMCLDIAEERLKSICNEKRSAQTNSLVVNILEHFVGNLVDLEENNDMNQIHGKPGLRERRDSLAAHGSEVRTTEYDPVVANLLGYAADKQIKIAPEDKDELPGHLERFTKDRLLLSGDAANGFVYVAVESKESTHALVLNDLVRNIQGEITGVSLINPWDTSKEPEVHPLEDLKKSKLLLTPYRPVLPQQEHALPQIPNDEDERRVQRGAMILEP